MADALNLSTTRWRVVADHQDRRYFLESVISPSVFWVDLDNLDFSQGSDVVKLDLGVDMERVLSGEVSAVFETAGRLSGEETQPRPGRLRPRSARIRHMPACGAFDIDNSISC